MENEKLNRDELISKIEKLEQDLIHYKNLHNRLMKPAEKLSEQENLANKYLNIVNSLIIALNPNGEITLLNKKGHDVLGYEEGELIGKEWFSTCLPKKISSTVKGYFKELMNGKVEDQETYENEIIRKDGQKRIIKWFNTLLRDNDGNINGLLSSGEDITEHKLAKQALTESEERLNLVIKGSNDAYWDWDFANKKIYYSPQWWAQIGYTPNELPVSDQLWYKLSHQEDRANIDAVLDKALKTNLENYKLEFRLLHKDGHYVPILSRGFIIRDAEGKILRLAGTNMDLTERKKAEEGLKRSADKHKTILKTALSGFWIVNMQGEIVEVNDAYCLMSGYSPDELLSMNISNIDVLETPDETKIRIKNLTKKGSDRFETKHLRKDGSFFDVEINIQYQPFDGGQFICFISDITERKQSEKALKQSETKYKNLIETASDAIYLMSEDGTIIETNQGACDMLAKSKNEIIGSMIDSIDPNFPIAEFLKFWKNIHFNEQAMFETSHLRKDGSFVPIEISGKKFKLDEKIFYYGVARDITERKRAEHETAKALEKAKDSEKKFRTLFTNSPIPTYTWQYLDGDFVLSNYNTAAFTLTQGKIANIIGIKAGEMYRDDEETLQGFKQCLQQKTTIAREMDYRFKTFGDKKYLNVKYTFIPPNRVMVHTEDFTDRKNAEREIKESQERFNLAMKASKDGIYDWNLLTNEIYYSPGWKSMLGYEYDEIPNDFSIWESHTEPEDAKKSWEMLNEVINKKRDRFEMEFRMKHKDGHWVEILSRADAIFDENGKAIRMIGTHVDISEQKKTERALINNQKRYKKAQAMGQVGNWEYNPVTTKFWTSDEGKRIYGFDPDMGNFSTEMVERCIPERERVHQALIDLIEKNKKYDLVFDIITHDKGIRKKIHSIAEAEKDAQGNIIKITGVISDVTERLKVEKELIIAKEKAEESDRLKSAFLANMSHEIRTPMNGILGFTTLLKEPGLSGKEQQQYISIIERSGARMLNTIHDIIDISKIESGQVDISLSDLNLNKAMDELFEFFYPEAQKKGLQLSFTNRLPDQQANIKSDTEKLNSILTNLIKNAIKYTHSGSIEFGYSLNKNPKSYELEFYVKDSGIGIQKNRLKAIFNRFEQADIDDRGAYEGSGLGLAISKAYIEMLGGKIWVTSKESFGSIFHFTLPYTPKNNDILKTNTTKPNKKQLPQRGLKILIVEDEEIVITYLTIVLKEFEKEILIAKTGIEAVEFCQKNPDIDLILMDIKIPQMNGYEATRKIRTFNKEVFILAQTAYAQAEDREMSIKAGCNDFITKPIDRGKLLGILKKNF